MSIWTTPSILTPERTEEAVSHLRTYFDGTAYAGSYFERLGGGGDRAEVANIVTADDLLALAMLSVPVDGHAARALLTKVTDVGALLAQIPRDATITSALGRELLSEDGSATQLWAELRKLSSFGPVRTSKLMARKRPHLVPVYDQVVAAQFGASNSADQWVTFVDLFQDQAFVNHLLELRRLAEVGDDISLLRTLDVAVWMEGRNTASSPRTTVVEE